MRPHVAVVIATRNRPEMMREALASVLGQDYDGPIEVVLVFDRCEPDLALQADDPHRRVVVTTNQRAPGLAGARNTGIGSTDAAYVAFLDDDDLWFPDKLSRQVTELETHAEAGLATTGIVVRYDGEEHPRTLDSVEVRLDDLLRDRHTELHPSTFLVRRSALVESIGLVDEEVPGGFGEDYDFLLRAAKHGPIRNVVEPFVVIRWGSQSYFFQRWPTMVEGLSWLLRRHPEFESSRRGSARIHGQVAFAEASMGHRKDAVRWAGGALRRNPLEPRTPLALAVALGVVKPDRVMAALHRRGRGI